MRTKIASMKYLLCFIAAVMMFGSSGIVASTLPLSAFEVCLMRLIIGALSMGLIFVVTRQRLPRHVGRRQYLFVALSGACLGLAMMTIFAAYRLLGVGLGAVAGGHGVLHAAGRGLELALHRAVAHAGLLVGDDALLLRFDVSHCFLRLIRNGPVPANRCIFSTQLLRRADLPLRYPLHGNPRRFHVCWKPVSGASTGGLRPGPCNKAM